MTSKEKKMCNGIIHTASVAAAGVGAGLAQVPCSDTAIITPIQLAMAISLGKVFELNIEESYAKSLIASAGATAVGRAATQVLLGWMPVVGNAINASTAAALTETIGWIMAKEFEHQSSVA